MANDDVLIVLNGCPTPVDAGESLHALLGRLELLQRPVAVEVNGELVPREQHAAQRLTAGDVVEVVTLVGGG